MATRTITAARISLIALSAALALPVLAAEKSWSLSGEALEVSTPCAAQIAIVPAAGAREITVNAAADHAVEIEALSVGGNGKSVTVTKQGNRCPLSQQRKRETLRLTIALPAGSDLSVREGGDGEYEVSVPVGRLELRLSGSGSLNASRVEGSLNASLSGSGGGDIREMVGQDARIHASGSGGMTIGGRVGRLEVSLSGSGDVEVAAAGSAELKTSGSGSIRADSLDGPLSFDASGSGALTVGTIKAEIVRIGTSGDGGVRIRDGRIDSLQVTGHGSADAEIGAVVGRAELSTSGSGDILVRQITGPVTQRHSGSGRVRIGG